MIVEPRFFKGEIYIPHAKSSITDSVTDVESKLTDFINYYEREALEKSLGGLAVEFFSHLDVSEPSLIKVGSDVKWDHLMNGREYVLSNGKTMVWKGIRRAVPSLGVIPDALIEPVYNYSFLAEYVYFYHERSDFISRTDAGDAKVKAANAQMVTPHFKAVNAWRRFVEKVQGKGTHGRYGVKPGFLGGYYQDFYGYDDSNDICLYQFIKDSNVTTETYQNFKPKTWGMINQFTM